MVGHWLNMQSCGLVEVLRRSLTQGELGDTALQQNLTQNTKLSMDVTKLNGFSSHGG